MNYTNRSLLDLARRVSCTLRRPGCTGTPTGPLHSNQLRHGKGRALKAHDLFHAAGCANCHRWLDEDPAPRADKDAAFQDAMEETWLEYWRQGWIVVQKPSRTRQATQPPPLSRIVPRIRPW